MPASDISRRNFVGALPLTLLATPALTSPLRGVEEASPSPLQEPQKPGFIGPLSEEEAAAVAASPMAQEIATLHGRGYPCSEMILLAGLRRFELDEEHLDAAAVFGGGAGKRDLCGLLTGGLMAIGFAAGEKYEDRGMVHRAGRQASNAYWDWWLTRGDLHCMGPGTEHNDAPTFLRMTQRTALRLEEVMGVLMEGGYEVTDSPEG
jgi:hypothetical protein